MSNVINSFRGKYYFLSNFYMAPVTYDGITYTNSEAAFQAQKCKNPADRKAFANLNPSEAKKKGRHVALRDDWESGKYAIMYRIVLEKFEQNPLLRLKLQATGDSHLEEGNNWGDRIWGTVNGEGNNLLGKILMMVRMELHKDNELVVLERENGWYGGYEVRDGDVVQVFNSKAENLFLSIKSYTDRGYAVACVDKSHEKAFMAERQTVGV